MGKEGRRVTVSDIVDSVVESTAPRTTEVDVPAVEEKNFRVLATHIPGFFLLVDKGANSDLTRGETEDLASTGPSYVARADIIKRLQAKQKDPHDDLKKMGKEIPGFRGARDVNSGWQIQVTNRYESVYDERLLRKSLGDLLPEYVHRSVSVTVELDPDKDDVEGFIDSVKRRLRRQGSKANPETVRNLRVDEEALQKLIDSGELILAEGAWTTRLKDTAVTPTVIYSEEDRKEADAPIQEELKQLGKN